MPRRKALRFVFVTACVGEDFFITVKKGMSHASRIMGVESVMTGVTDVDDRAEIELIRQAVREGADGIAINLTHPTAFNEVVAETLDRGVPVVAFNVDSQGTGNRRLSCVCQDLYAAGKSLGEVVSPHIQDGANVLVTLHSMGISALDDRLRGMQDALAKKKLRWETVVTGTDPDKAARTVASVIRGNARIDAILCTGLADTQGSGMAVASDCMKQKPFIAGFDLSPKILELIKCGIITYTVDQQPYIQGFYPVVQLTLLIRYGIRPSDINSGAAIIGQEAADTVIKGNNPLN